MHQVLLKELFQVSFRKDNIFSHNFILDTSCFIHKELGLGDSGKPSLSVHSTCLSFMVAFHMCAGLIESGMYEKILIVSTEISTVGLNFEQNPRKYFNFFTF